MANLYLTEQGSILRKSGDRLIVQKDEDILLDVQCSKIDAVLIFGNVQFTTQAIHELFEHGIEMALLTRSGRLIGQLTSPSTKNIELRIEQFKKHGDNVFKLNLSRAFVSGKINNGLNVIRAFSYNHPEIRVDEEVAQLNASLKDVSLAEDIAKLRGIEGFATRTYFNGFRKMMLGEFTFEERRRHPSTDPVNALLSLGYTLIFNEISSLLDGLGFDPYMGYFHSAEYGRASLASDIQEEFRPIVDRLTLNLINNRILKKEDFFKNPKGEDVYLKRDAMKRYFVEYENYLSREFKHAETGESTSIRKCFRIQAEKLANCIKSGSLYTTFKLET